MDNIQIKENGIIVINKTKKWFSKEYKERKIEYLWDDIEKISIQKFRDELSGITIFFRNNTEANLIKDENINFFQIHDEIIEKAKQFKVKMVNFEIDTGEETTVE